MAAEKSLAIVLKVVDFSETSCVVTLFTREFGKISALAKGVRRPRNPFEAALDVLSICRIVFLRKKSDSLDLLTEAKLQRRFRATPGQLDRLYAAYYVIELLRLMTDDADPHTRLYDLAEQTIEALDEGALWKPCLIRFQAQLLEQLGHQPSLYDCVECGKPIEPILAGHVAEARSHKLSRVYFALAQGGVICQHCRVGRRQVVALSRAALDQLKQFAGESSETAISDDSRANGNPLAESRALMDQYLCHVIGRRPRMQEFLRSRK